MSDTVRFTNGYIARADGTMAWGDLYVSPASGRIISGQEAFFASQKSPTRTIDLCGNILAPGLIDAQINGAYGIDFSELDPEDPQAEEKYLEGIDTAARQIVETGCTSFVPTIITQKEELYAKLLRLLAPRTKPGSAQILGYHAEGPFLFPSRRGAHSETLLMNAASSTNRSSIDVLERVYGAGGLNQPGVKIITLAPDVEGVMECIPELSRRGVTVSLGHTNATLEVAEQAVKQGARMITHLFNAMPPIHHRDPGLIGLLGSNDSASRPYYGIIVDGLHSHPNTVRIAYGACKEGCILVTDAQSPMDPRLPDGVHNWRPGVQFRKEGHKVTIEGTDTLAGSCCPLWECVRNLSTFTNIPLSEALLTATKHPADLLGLRKGRLEEGWDADLVVLGRSDGTVKSTWVAGKEVYRDPHMRKGDSLDLPNGTA